LKTDTVIMRRISAIHADRRWCAERFPLTGDKQTFQVSLQTVGRFLQPSVALAVLR
jgi:hypothetical protein